MGKKPIEIFKSDKQLEECCKYWKRKLFLNDWFIHIFLTENIMVTEEEGHTLWGVCENDFNNKEATITIYNGKDTEVGTMRNIAELTLVHELLHLKNEYNTELDADEKSFHNYIAHQSLEMMAKTLIMVRYNLDYSYFVEDGSSKGIS